MRIINNNLNLEFFYYVCSRFKRSQLRNNKYQYMIFLQGPSEKKRTFVPHRAFFDSLARNDLSFRETVVVGLNFLRQGQKSELSDGWVNEQVGDSTRDIEWGRESGRKREAERRRQSDIRDGTQTLVYPLTHPLPFCHPSNPRYLYTHT